jgi:hypothetical protein
MLILNSRSKGRDVADLVSPLRGLSIVAIGGDPRPNAIRKVREELGLADVEWVPSRESHPCGRAYAFRALKSQPDIVVLLIGLMRHQQVADVRQYCRRSGVPCLTLRRSLSAAQLARAWRSQCYLIRNLT